MIGPRPVPRVDPAFIAGVLFLRRSCSVNDMATILGCDRKRVLTVLARLKAGGAPAWQDPAAPRYRALTPAQQAEIAALHGNGLGLDFYALCRVVRDAHPLAIFVFLRHQVGPRGWWVRACIGCGEPVATAAPGLRLCRPECGTSRRAEVSA